MFPDAPFVWGFFVRAGCSALLKIIAVEKKLQEKRQLFITRRAVRSSTSVRRKEEKKLSSLSAVRGPCLLHRGCIMCITAGGRATSALCFGGSQEARGTRVQRRGETFLGARGKMVSEGLAVTMAPLSSVTVGMSLERTSREGRRIFSEKWGRISEPSPVSWSLLFTQTGFF